jgi:hypothetical protein
LGWPSSIFAQCRGAYTETNRRKWSRWGLASALLPSILCYLSPLTFEMNQSQRLLEGEGKKCTLLENSLRHWNRSLLLFFWGVFKKK